MGRTKRYMVAAPYLRPNMLFEDAAHAFVKALDFNPEQDTTGKLLRHAGFIGVRTLEDYRTTFKALGKHFSGKRLQEITPSDFRGYQEKRSSGQYTDQEHRPANMQGPGVNSNTVNKELGALLRVLKSSKAWTAEMAELYITLTPQDSDKQRALSPSEQEHFLRVAASKEKWSMVYWYSIFALATTMSTNETRNLRRRHLDTQQGIATVGNEGAKNKYRMRSVPLSDSGCKAAEWLLATAQNKGSRLPDHFVFPFRVKRNEFDSTRCSEFFLRPHFEEVRRAADLSWLRPYDLRHTAITRLAEAGTPIQVIMDMAGHVSQKMQMHYTHISMQAKRKAVDLSALTQAAAIKKRPGVTVREMAFSAAEKVDSAIGAGAVSVGNLIKKLQRAGLGSEMILGILADEGE